MDEKTDRMAAAETALRSCVSLLAAVTAQREETLELWLELYYQTRVAMERERAREPDATVLRRQEIYPVLRELMQDALKSALHGEAKERIAKREAAKKPATPEKAGPEDNGAAEAAPPKKSGAADAAAFKRLTLERLEQAKAEGVTIAQIVRAADGCVTDEQILDILGRRRVPIAVYRVLDAALDCVERGEG